MYFTVLLCIENESCDSVWIRALEYCEAIFRIHFVQNMKRLILSLKITRFLILKKPFFHIELCFILSIRNKNILSKLNSTYILSSWFTFSQFHNCEQNKTTNNCIKLQMLKESMFNYFLLDLFINIEFYFKLLCVFFSISLYYFFKNLLNTFQLGKLFHLLFTYGWIKLLIKLSNSWNCIQCLRCHWFYRAGHIISSKMLLYAKKRIMR